MTEATGLICAYLLDGRGGGRELDWDEAIACQPGEGECLWLHLDYSQPHVQAWMHERSGLSAVTAEALLQAETRPRCTTADDGLMIFLRGANFNPGADPEDMVSIRMWLGERRVISLRQRRLLSVDDVRHAISVNLGPVSPASLLFQLLDFLHDRIDGIVDDFDDRVAAVEEALVEKEPAELRAALPDLRREAIVLRRYLTPQRDALSRLSTERSTILDEQNRLQAREEYDRMSRLTEELDAARERVQVIHESLTSSLAETTNQRMYILSLIAGIFLPLSFVTGLLGINVGGIPLTGNSLGFVLVSVLLLVTGLAIWLFFKRRNWF